MNFKTKTLVLFLILTVLLSVSVVSANEINETSQAVADDSQNEVVLESNSDENVLKENNGDDVLKASDESSVLEVSNDNAAEPILSMVVSNELDSNVCVESDNGGSVSKLASSADPVLKSSSGQLKKVTLNSKYNKYVTKKVGKYKIKVYKWKGYRLGGLNIYLTKNGKYVKSSSFSTRAYYKMNGKWRWSSWSHASRGYESYHHYPVDSDVKITKVQVKFRYR